MGVILKERLLNGEASEIDQLRPVQSDRSGQSKLTT